MSYKNNGAGESGGINHELDHSEKESTAIQERKKKNHQAAAAAAAFFFFFFFLFLFLLQRIKAAAVEWVQCSGVTSGEANAGCGLGLAARGLDMQDELLGYGKANCAVPQESSSWYRLLGAVAMGLGLVGPGAYKR